MILICTILIMFCDFNRHKYRNCCFCLIVCWLSYLRHGTPCVLNSPAKAMTNQIKQAKHTIKQAHLRVFKLLLASNIVAMTFIASLAENRELNLVENKQSIEWEGERERKRVIARYEHDVFDSFKRPEMWIIHVERFHYNRCCFKWLDLLFSLWCCHHQFPTKLRGQTRFYA